MENKSKKIKSNSNATLYAFITAIAVLTWALTGNKGLPFLFVGIFHVLLFVNITICTITNMLVNSVVDQNDAFWRMFCIVAGSLFLAIGIAFV